MSTQTLEVRKVLIDQTGSARLSLVEDKQGKRLFAEGKIGQCDVPTANGRVYPRQVMEREVARLQERINSGSLLGAVDHPGDGKSRVMEAGHIVRKLWIESDGSVHGKFEIVEESDAGRNLAAFLKHGATIGVSSRGLGSTRINESGQEVVTEDFKLASYDFVSDPAVSTAYPQFFTEDKDLADKITADALRAKFPKLIKQIEESAHEVAKNTCFETVRAELETEVEQALTLSKEDLREDIKAELLPELIKELRDDFGVKLVRSLQSMRKEVEESVRSELSSDPKVAGAKLALEQVAKLISPYNLPADAKQMLGEKDSTVASLRADLESNKKTVSEAETRAVNAESKARELAFKLFVEQALVGRDDTETLRKMVGDVSSFRNAKELKLKVEGVIQTAEEARELAEARVSAAQQTEKKLNEHKINLARRRADTVETEKNRVVNELERKLNHLTERMESFASSKSQELSAKSRELSESEARVSRLEEKLNGAINLAESVRLQAYTEQRAVGHPQRRELLDSVAKGKAKTRKEVNQLAEALDTEADEPGGVNERVRRAMSRGRESMREAERVKQEVLNDDLTPIPGLEEVGVSMEEIMNLSGIDKSRGKNK